MSDTPIRKKLSLKVKKPIESELTSKSGLPIKAARLKVAVKESNRVKIASSNPADNYLKALAKQDSLLNELQEKRTALLTKIKILEQRLIFTSSQPLAAVCNELRVEDTRILCQINNHLLA